MENNERRTDLSTGAYEAAVARYQAMNTAAEDGDKLAFTARRQRDIALKAIETSGKQLYTREWKIYAACKERPDVIESFTPKSQGGDNPDIRMAKSICATCRVKDMCLDHAITHEESGVWGETTTIQRHTMQRKNPEKIAMLRQIIKIGLQKAPNS